MIYITDTITYNILQVSVLQQYGAVEPERPDSGTFVYENTSLQHVVVD